EVTLFVNSLPTIISATANPSSICIDGDSQLDVIGDRSANKYNFLPSSGSFIPLVGGVDVNSIEADDAVSGAIPIGFDFNFGDIDYSNIYASSNGFLSFNPAATSSLTNNLTSASAELLPLIAPLWDDLDGR